MQEFPSNEAPERGADVAAERAGGLLSQSMVIWMILMVVSLLAHGLALGADFFMDDTPHLLQNEWLKEGAVMSEPLRLVPNLAWAGMYRVAGFNPMAFHLLTLLAHLATVTVAWRVGRQWLAERGPAGEVAAFFGAALFACHPLGSEAVNYAAQFSIQLVALFSLLAAGLGRRLAGGEGRSLRTLNKLILVLVLGGLSKEVGLIYCGMSAVAAFLMSGKWGGVWKRAGLSRQLRARSFVPSRGLTWVALAALVPVVAVGIHRVGGIWWRLLKGTMSNDFQFNHFLTQGGVFWGYVHRFVWPAALCSDHHVPLSLGLADVPSVVKTGLTLLFFLSVAAGLCWRRTRPVCRLLALALVPLLFRFIYVNKEFMVEYRTYPALPWACLAVGLGVAWCHARQPQLVKWVAVAVLIAACGRSSLRSLDWHSEAGLAEENLKEYPANNRQRGLLMRSEYLSGNYDRVLQLAADARKTREAMEDWNAAHAGVKVFDYSQLYRFYATTEYYAAWAKVTTEGSASALAHANRVIEGLAAISPDFVNPQSTSYEVGGQLVKARNAISRCAPALDRLRVDKNDREALAQLRDMKMDQD